MFQSTNQYRHCCLHIYLWIMLLTNLFLFILMFIGVWIAPAAFYTMYVILGMIGFGANIACVAALFYWKRWGFYGVVLLACIGFVLNLGVQNVGHSMAAVASVGLLYVLLHVDAPDSAWSRMN